MSPHARVLWPSALSFLLIGCSSQLGGLEEQGGTSSATDDSDSELVIGDAMDENDYPGAGGASAGGASGGGTTGAGNSGGSGANGSGGVASGGAQSSGGSNSSGGNSSSGGATSSGGTTSSGGMSSSGGTSSGGTASSGGSNSSGGTSSSGGSDSSGGASSSGGSDGSGGDPGPTCDNSYPAFSCPAGTWPSDQASAEVDMLALVNAARQSSNIKCGGVTMPSVSPLTMDEDLRCAARVHSQDMADRDFFSHATWNPDACGCIDENDNTTCPAGQSCRQEFPGTGPFQCGKSPATRVSETGGPSGAYWENIAAGYPRTTQQIFDGWMASTGHCQNIMRAGLKTIGIGYAKGSGRYQNYWTQAFND